ncbi:PAS domain-containing protein [Methanosarcina barkeri]|uniref:PAS domain-containing protein n=1 Tax=Methanosarcina barkeri TaxID=2208 RepID=UPI001FB405C2|nr:PAS domain-containing protein [Methanosarcina barkeri]
MISKRLRKNLRKKVKSGVSTFSLEYRIVTKTGDLRWINERTFIQRDKSGEVTYFQGVVLDITRRKKKAKKN